MSKKDSALLTLLRQSGAQAVLKAEASDLGLSEQPPYPFVALVGQVEMRIALLLALVNPTIGGVLLIGPRGTGKTTAVRSLLDILPDVEVSDCEEGVLPDDMENPNAKLLYPDCYEKMQAGEEISHYEPVKLIELPLNARLEDVVGGMNERVAIQRQTVRLERGILGRADNNLLYVDEVNLLDDQIVDAILDAAAQGNYTVRRGPMAGNYRSRFVLIGSMNPEEGRLRPQIMDRFGLRINVGGLTNPKERLEVYKRVRNYRQNPQGFVRQWEEATMKTLEEIFVARELLKLTELTDKAQEVGLGLVRKLEIDSMRAEITMFEAARAYAASDGRLTATVDDIRAVAPMVLRQRRSEFMTTYFKREQEEERLIASAFDVLVGKENNDEA